MQMAWSRRHASVMGDDIPSLHRLTMTNDNVASNTAAESARDCVCHGRTLGGGRRTGDSCAHNTAALLDLPSLGHGMWKGPKDQLLRPDSKNATL